MRTTKYLKYKHKQPGTYWFGRFWSTIATAAHEYGVPATTIRQRMERGLVGFELVAPKFTVDRKLKDKGYRDKLRAIAKAYDQTPGELAAEAGVTQDTMRYRIKQLDILEILKDKRMLLEGWTPRQLKRKQVDARLAEIEREKIMLEDAERARQKAEDEARLFREWE